jgi:hypothetical protein
MVLPLMFYAQTVCGLSPTRSALLTAPMAITSGLLAPIVGKIVDRSHPRSVVGFGFSVLAIGLTWLSIAMTPSAPIWQLVLPFIALGFGMAFIWAPLAATATRNLPGRLAGAGSGVYNATRQVGAVLGSAGMASFMTSRITSEMPPMADGDAFGPPGGDAATLQLPGFLREPFSAAMSQSMLLPAFISLFGVSAALFMIGFTGAARDNDARPRAGVQRQGHEDASEARTRRIRLKPNYSDDSPDHHLGNDDVFDDDDHYVEFMLSPAQIDPHDVHPTRVHGDDTHTEPLPTPQVESWRDLLDDNPEPNSIGFAHNGFHVDEEQRFRPVQEFRPDLRRAGNRRYRAEPDDIGGHGRHSFPDR